MGSNSALATSGYQGPGGPSERAAAKRLWSQPRPQLLSHGLVSCPRPEREADLPQFWGLLEAWGFLRQQKEVSPTETSNPGSKGIGLA